MSHPSGPVADAFPERIRRLEQQSLSTLAVRSYDTAGRLRPEPAECSLRTPFQRDRDRIVHSKAFRRLKGKTQVFIAPQGDHFRTRMTHTLEVSGISRGVARALRLNEDLTEAIALGHDLGHPPFGHTGEEALDRCLKELGSGFRHNLHSLRMVDVLERGGAGLNLTAEVRDGIRNHTGDEVPRTLEGRIVRIVDRFAYVNHDIDDSARAGLLRPDDLPGDPVALLGQTSSVRIDALVHDLVETSDQAGDVEQSPRFAAALQSLRSYMFEHVYLGPAARAQSARAAAIVSDLFAHHLAEGDAESATDWVAGMTDGYALRAHAELLAARAERSPA
jgi:dGTPase